MLLIGAFSRLTRVPAKTLRYYDDIELFKPAHYDPETGYRYYSVEQLPRLHRIVALKGLGMSLDQIKSLLKDNVSPEEIRGMLKMKRAEIIDKLEEEAMRLMLLESYLNQLDNEDGDVQYDVVLKPIDAICVASVRGIMPKLELIGETVVDYLSVLHAHLEAHYIKPIGAHCHIYHDEELHAENIDIEIAYPIAESNNLPDSDRVIIRTLEPIEQMASAVHHGPFVNMLRANVAIMRWISDNGYEVDGPYRELYLQYQPMGDQQNCVTEVQFPVIRSRLSNHIQEQTS